VWFKNRRAKCRQQQKAAEQINKVSTIKNLTPTTATSCCKTPSSGADSTTSDEETATVSYLPPHGGATVQWSRDCWNLAEPAHNYYMPHCVVNSNGYSSSCSHNCSSYYGNGAPRPLGNEQFEYNVQTNHRPDNSWTDEDWATYTHRYDNSWTDTNVGLCYTNDHKFHAL